MPCPGGRELVVLGDGEGATPVAALLRDRGPAVARAPGDLRCLPFSSGTGGLPKPVMLTHANVAAGARQVGIALSLTAGDAVLALPPFAHVMGFAVTLCAPLLAGATVVTMPRFELETMLALLDPPPGDGPRRAAAGRRAARAPSRGGPIRPRVHSS